MAADINTTTAIHATAVIAFTLALFMLSAGSVSAYEYNLPVSISATVNPSVLMPGDEAVMAIELQLISASGKGEGTGSSATSQSMTAPGTGGTTTQSSTTVHETKLKGSSAIRVLTPDYENLGTIGLGDKVVLYYRIKADENISTGTYLLDFSVLGPDHEASAIQRQIPVKVDSSSVSIARADSSSASSINLNVANPRENTLNAVTLIPRALTPLNSSSKSSSASAGIVFSPDKYYIGTMDPDEVFTISFSIESALAGAQTKGPINLSFTAQYKNGDTWHTSEPFYTSYTQVVVQSQQPSYLMPAIAILLILLAGGAWMYRKKKQKRTGKS